MREKNRTAWRRIRAFLIIGSIALVFLGIKNRILVKEFLMSVFS